MEQVAEMAEKQAITNEPDADVAAQVEAEWAACSAAGCDTEAEAVLHKYVRVSLRLDDEEDRLKAQFAANLRDIENRRKGLEYVHGAFARSVAETMLAGRKQKSMKLPFGTFGFRTQNTKIEVENEDAVLSFASNEHPEWIVEKTTRTVPKSTLSDYFKDTGDVPLGCKVVPESQKFYVAAPKGGA